MSNFSNFSIPDLLRAMRKCQNTENCESCPYFLRKICDGEKKKREQDRLLDDLLLEQCEQM